MSTKTPKQTNLFKKGSNCFGGELFKKRKGRAQPRPLATKRTMHLVLRSSKAKGDWSFLKPINAEQIKNIFHRFSAKYGVKILSLANVGNHLHIHLKLGNRSTYAPFIRAVTGAIAMAVTGQSRWAREKDSDGSIGKLKFWDYRPFSRIVVGLRAFLSLKDYLLINHLEGQGYFRSEARILIRARGS